MTNNPFKIIWAAIKSSFSKENFSWTNFVNFANIVITVFTSMAAVGTIPMGISILVVSVITFILKLVQSHKMLIETGVNQNPMMYTITLAGIALGCFEVFVKDGYISQFLGESATMWVTIAYSILLMYLRTGYSNQVEVAKEK